METTDYRELRMWAAGALGLLRFDLSQAEADDMPATAALLRKEITEGERLLNAYYQGT